MSEQEHDPRPLGRRRRSRAAGGRPHTIRVTLSDAEYLPIHAAAIRAGISDASWLGQIGARVAAQPAAAGPPRGWGEAMQALMMVRGELAEDRRVLRNVGGNLNDIARQANTDGNIDAVLGAQAADVLALVGRVVERIDQAVTALDEETATARRARLGGAD